MGLGIGPDPVARSLETAQPSASAPETAQTLDRNALTPAVAALPERWVAGLDQMMQTVSGHLNAIRGEAAPPPNFAGALAAHDQVLASLGLPIPDTHADVRSTLAAQNAAAQSGVMPRGPSQSEPAQNAPAQASRQLTRGAENEHTPEDVRAALSLVRGAIERGGGTISAEDANRIEAEVRALGPGDTRRLFVGVPASDGHASVAGLSVPEVTKWMTAVSLHSPQQRTLLFDMLASRNLSADSFTTLARGIQAGTESRFSQADVTDGRLLELVMDSEAG